MFCGIYRIFNIENRKYYVGSAKNVYARWWRHKNDLKANKHNNIHLQRAWDKYGRSAFIFDLLEVCREDERLALEQKYLDGLDFSIAYNIGKSASGGDNITHNPNRTAIIEKISAGGLKRYETMDSSERKRLADNLRGAGNGNFGNKWNDEQRAVASERMIKKFEEVGSFFKGKKFEDIVGEEKAIEWKAKLSKSASLKTGDKNPFYGRHHTEEFKKEQSEIRKGVYNGGQETPISIDGTFFRSLSEASKKTGVPTPTILWRANSKNPKFDGYVKVEKNVES